MILLRTLGDCTIEIGDTRLAPDSEILFSLLAYLIVERGRPIPRSVLLEFFWTNEEDSKARHCLRQSIYKLRRMGVPIETRNDRYVLEKLSAAVDFENAEMTRDAVTQLGELPSLTLLPGYAPAASPEFITWLDGVRDSGASALRRCLMSALAVERRENRWPVAERLARFYLAHDPLNEEATLTLAEALALRGSKREAVVLLNGYANDVGSWGRELRLPAVTLRNRISERAAFDHNAFEHSAPLIGREDGINFLASLSRRVSAGTGQTCLLYGDAGIGKTRLVDEFGNLAALQGFRIVRVECRASGANRALSLFMELAPQLLRLPGALGCSPEALALVRRLAQHEPQGSAHADSYSDAEALHARIRSSILDLIDSLAGERPIIVVVEDVHWIDSVSLSVLEEVIASNKRRALFLLATARTEYLNAFVSGVSRREVILHRLSPLTNLQSRTLALRLLDSSSAVASEQLLSWCVAHACGNPLFIIELVRHWRETGDSEGIPPSLEGLIEERLGKVSQLALRMLQAVTLLGKQSSHERVSAVLNLPHWQLLDGLEELERNGLAIASIDGIQPRHELLARAAVEKMTSAGRSFVHHNIARSLESSPDSSCDTTALWDAATHWSAAGDKRRALALAHVCAQHVLSMGLPFEASEVLREALAFTSSDVERLQIYDLRRDYLKKAGSWEELIRNCECAIELGRQGTEALAAPHSAFELALYAAHCAQHSASNADVIGKSLLCVLDQDAPLSHRLAAAASGLIACYADCRESDAVRFIEAVGELKPCSAEDRKNALLSQLVFHIEYGDLDAATAAGDDLLAWAEHEQNEALLIRFLRLSTYPYRYTGNFEVVEERLRRALQLAESRQNYGEYREVLMAEGQHCCAVEDYARGQKISEELEALFATKPHLICPTAYQVCAEIALKRGNVSAGNNFLARLTAYPTTSVRYASDRLALRVYSELCSGQLADDSTVVLLDQAHRTLCGKAGQDFPSATLAEAFARRGETARAREMARFYLAHRRERWPLRNAFLVGLLQ
jgi:DNA-binding SARP family transcriptional activator